MDVDTTIDTLTLSVNSVSMITDYSSLNNKPSINSVTLTGNKTDEDLNLQHKLDPGGGITLMDDVVSVAILPGETSLQIDQDYLCIDQSGIKTSNLTNDAGFVTSDVVSGKLDKVTTTDTRERAYTIGTDGTQGTTQISPYGSIIAKYEGNYRLTVGTPSTNAHATPKSYVDLRVPPWTSSDEGKILKIVNGTPTWTSE